MAQPATNGSSLHLPLIDISSPTPESCKKLLAAAAEWGFLYVKFTEGLGMGSEDVERLFGISRKFFSSSTKEKEAVKIGPDDMGWSAPYGETLDQDQREQADFKEALNLGEFKDSQPRQPMPASLQDHIVGLDAFARAARGICLRLLEMFAVALEISETEGGTHWFSSRHAEANGQTGSILRLLYYPTPPASSASSTTLRCGAHTDFGTLTLLFQRAGQPGLEILDPSGNWLPVIVHPPSTENDRIPPIVVNIGDMLSYWTNEYLRSTKHRVVIPWERKDDRYSVAYFCHPARETMLIPVPSEVVRASFKESKRVSNENFKGENAKAITAEEHLRRKLVEVYGWEK